MLVIMCRDSQIVTDKMEFFSCLGFSRENMRLLEFLILAEMETADMHRTEFYNFTPECLRFHLSHSRLVIRTLSGFELP